MLLRFPGKNQHKSDQARQQGQQGKNRAGLVYSKHDLERLDLQITEEQVQIEKDCRNTAERARRMLSMREHSAQELTRKLLAKGHVEKLVFHVVGELKEQGLISDQRFAESFVRSRIAKGNGPILICGELRSRGVSERILEDVLTHTTKFWLQLAQDTRDKRFSNTLEDKSDSLEDQSYTSQDPKQAYWAKQARFLSRRGFPADIIYRVLERS